MKPEDYIIQNGLSFNFIGGIIKMDAAGWSHLIETPFSECFEQIIAIGLDLADIENSTPEDPK